jgi:hypothetical protein
MIEVDGRTRSSLYGLVGVLLGAGWIAYGIIGNNSKTFLVIMIILTVVLPSLITFVLRARKTS